MKAFVIKKPFEAGVFEVDKPVPKADEVLIKVAAAGFCGTDIHTFKGEHVTNYPIIPGHEFSGIVEEAGEEVTQFKAGDRVIADPNVFCEKCRYCKQNKQIHCEDIQVIGNTRNGAFAEYVTVPERCVFPAGEMDLVEGSMAEPLACVINSHNKACIPIGADVLICGAGTIGLMQLMMARRRGAGSVTIIDIKEPQLSKAKELGADHAVMSDEHVEEKLRELYPQGFDFIIEATGVPKVGEMAVKLLADTGTYVAFGVCPTDSEIKINPFDIYYRDLKIIGSYALQKTMPQSISMINGGLDLKPLIGQVISLEEMPEKFADFVAGKTSNKIIVKFS
ncbi:MAG: zinc-dependent alcohol dehydrogenase family protein [Eubacteriales bacterium]|nr:zinc-dependent alcohol dehydrogenase family protein [Eubacteriales bacterium]